MRTLLALLCGTLFGAGLTIAGMTDPARVIGFLDVFGHWDPTLAVVMASALAVSMPGFQFALRASKPVFDQRYFLPERTRIDADLLIGAALFGIGWGIAGFCPSPAIAGLATGSPQIIAFVLSMLAGMVLRCAIERRRSRQVECRT